MPSPYTDADIGPILSGLGYRYVSGYGPSAIWLSPDGKTRMAQATIAGFELGELSPYATPKNVPEQASVGNTINVNGRVMLWNTATGRYDIDQGPVTFAPQQAPAPSVFTEERTGDVVGVNRNGAEVFRIKDAQWPTISPQEQERIRQGDVATAQRFSTSERLAGEQFRTGERVAGEQFTGNQSAIERALEASRYAATFGANQQTEARATQQQAYTQARANQEDALAAAQQYAALISQVDPAALPAFLAAGGGNISNAIASGADALSTGALLPAARTLRGIDAARRPAPFAYTPQTFSPFAYNAAQFGAQQAPVQQTSVLAPKSVVLPAAQANLAAGILPSAANSSDYENRPTTPEETALWQRSQGIPEAVIAAGLAAPRYAFGTIGQPARGTFIAGDSTNPTNPAAGGANPEQITLQDPPGPNNAQAQVQPLTPLGGGSIESAKMAALFHAIGDFLGGPPAAMGQPSGMPRYAFGTEDLATSQDQPYINQVRTQRQATPQPNPFPGQVGDPTYNVGFWRALPIIREQIARARQAKFGIPFESVLQQASQYALPGISRGALSFGR